MIDIQRWYPCIGYDPDPYVEIEHATAYPEVIVRKPIP